MKGKAKAPHNGTWSDQLWLLAVIAADKSGNLSPLAIRLRSTGTFSRYGRELIADLLERHQLKKRRGGRRSLIYASPSDDQLRVITADAEYYEDKRKNESREDAIKRLANVHGCDERQLRNYMNNQGGTARRFRNFTRKPRDPR